MKVTGKVVDISKSLGGRYKLTVEVNETRDFENEIDEIKDLDRISIEVKKWREKRSLDANTYCWVLIGKIAEKLADDDVKNTKEGVYRAAIREIGVYKDFPNMSPDDAKTIRTAWGMLGTGWVTEQVDYSHDGKFVTIRCYYGSSTYNTKQMSRLIDNLVQDCKALGIPTETPEQIAMMKEAWDG